MVNLLKKKCEACKGDAEPLEGTAVELLLEDLGGGWAVVNDHHLEKEFIFKDFKEALNFTNKVGELAEREGHHPEIILSWGKVRILTWTHKINGLSENDFILAAKCDQLLSNKG